MRSAILFALLPVVLSSTAIQSHSKDNTTSTTSKVTTAPVDAVPVLKTDERFARKVDYDAKQGRLHSVVEDLAALAKADIRTGTTSEDWHVRDIPVTVNVKDYRLDRLMLAIADATHTMIAVTRDDSGKVKYYRYVRDKRTQREIAETDQTSKDRSRERASWVWDAVAKFGGTSGEPELDMERMERDMTRWAIPEDKRAQAVREMKEQLDYPKRWRPAGKILAGLGPDAKARLLAGEPVMVKDDNSQYAGLLKELGDLIMPEDSRLTDASGLTLTLKNSLLIRLQPHGLCATLFSGSTTTMLNRMDLPIYSTAIDLVKGMDLPQSPEDERQTKKGLPDTDKRFVTSEEGWSAPVFRKQVKLKAPEDVKEMTPAEVLVALSEASGFNIVAEDFRSHNKNVRIKVDALTKPETTIGTVLKLLSGDSPEGFWWSVNEESKTITGWAKRWRAKHLNLVPETMFSNMKTKLEGQGLQIDEVAAIMNLTQDQFIDWVVWCSGTDSLGLAFYSSGKTFWQMYSCLTSADKALCLSEGGLPLSKFDPGLIRQFIRNQSRETWGSDLEAYRTMGTIAVRDIYRLQMDEYRMWEALSDPEKMASLTMRVKREKADYRPTARILDGVQSRYRKTLPKGQYREQYRMTLRDDSDEKRSVINVPEFPISFPVYSLEREEALEKAAAKEKPKT